MLTIRLQRRGRTNDPSFRVVVVESKKAPQTGNYLEMLGSYDPRTDKAELNAERITHWIGNGAQTSDTVHNLLISKKILSGKKINVLPKKTVEKKEEAAAPAPEAAEAPAEAAAEPEAAGAGDNAVEEEKAAA